MTRLVDAVLAPFARLLPSAGTVGDRRRRAATATAAVLLISFVVHVAYAAAGTGASELADLLVNRVARQIACLAAVVLCALRVRRDDPDRGAWLSLTIGLALWVAGQTYWNEFLASAEDPPIPSFADAGRLGFYPFAYLSLGLHVRRTVRGVPASMWLDGLVGVLAIAAVGIAVVVAPIMADAGGTTAELVVNASYPIGDVLLMALVIACLCLGGGGRGLAWMLLGLGFALFAFADSAYLLKIAIGVTESSPLLSSVWLAGITTMAFAVWQPAATHRQRPPRTSRSRCS